MRTGANDWTGETAMGRDSFELRVFADEKSTAATKICRLMPA